MQSSATVACRAGVMLVCLIVIPMAALFGTKLPGFAERLLDQPWDQALLADLLPDWGASEQAPSYAPTVSTPPWRDDSAPRSLIQRPDEWRLQPTDLGGDRTVHAGYDAPIELEHGDDTSNGPSNGPLKSCPDPPQLVPIALAGGDDAAADARGPSSTTQAPVGTTRSLSLETDREAVAIQQRLRELGAAYYALETWGAKGRLFRFHARMALGTGTNRLQHFQAVDADPIRAMAAVLRQVEQCLPPRVARRASDR